MIHKIIMRICPIIMPIIGITCLIAMWMGAHMPTTRVTAYLYHLGMNKHTFGIADVNRRISVYAPVPFESEWEVSFSPDGKRALMTLDFYSQTEFYMHNLATNALTRFPLGYNTCAPPRETIRWSPNNRQVSFHCRPNTVSSALNGLHLWDTDNNSIQRIYNPSTLTIVPFTWSPTGEFISVIDNGLIMLINTRTGDNQRLSVVLSPYQLMQWSPDGDYIALGAPDKLLLYNTKTHVITSAPLDNGAFSVLWSPNSQSLAMIVQDSGFFHVQMWDIVDNRQYDIGSNRHPLNSVVDLRWSDDSQWIVVQEDINQATRLARILVASQDGTQTYHVVSDGRYPRWIPNRHMITYHITQIERLRYGRDLVTVSLENIQTGNIKPQVLVRDVLNYTWLNDGQLLSWRSIDRYGRIRALMLIPTGNDIGWSLFPVGYTVNAFAVWQ
jgi:WD40 repeat protein